MVLCYLLTAAYQPNTGIAMLCHGNIHLQLFSKTIFSQTESEAGQVTFKIPWLHFLMNCIHNSNCP